MPKKIDSPIVSVVVTTKNEEKNIERCLRSIKRQNFPIKQIEVIIVDNNSTDKTKRIAGKYTKHIYNAGPERSAQRNYGASKSKGKFYLYLDADMELSSQVIKKCVDKFTNDNSLRGLYIPEIVKGNNFWSKIRRFERSFYNATAIDCVRFVKLSDFNKVGGFATNMSGPEDWDFDKKIRKLGRVDSVSSALHHNESQVSLLSYLKKKEYYSSSFQAYIKKWGKDDPDIKKQFGINYRYFWVFVEKGKWRKLIKHPILAISMFSIRILVGITYLKTILVRTIRE